MIRRGPRRTPIDGSKNIDVLPRIRPLGETSNGSPHRTTPQSEYRPRRRKRTQNGCCKTDSSLSPRLLFGGSNRVFWYFWVILLLIAVFVAFQWRSKVIPQRKFHHQSSPKDFDSSLLKQLPPESHRRPRTVASPIANGVDSKSSELLLQVPKVNLSLLPFVKPKDPLPTSGPDFGGLKIRILEDISLRQERRRIYKDFEEDLGFTDLLYYADDDGDVEFYYAFDDDEKRNPLTIWDDPDIHTRKKCRRTSWHRDLPINCNMLHELDVLSRMRAGDTRYLGAGSYREVYLSQLPNDATVVFKTYYWGSHFEYTDFEFMRMDAIVNEKLNGHSRIVSSYGFCGMSIIGEAMTHGDLDKWAIPSGVGRIDAPLNDKEHLVVGNELTGVRKLELSLEMVEAVLLLHSYPGGVIVHDDIQLSQFLMSPSGELKLNDFNRAEIMLWNEKDFEYCKYRNHPGIGDWRAPEEYYDKPLDESIDIWSLGHNMYSILTGLYPYYDIPEEQVPEKVKQHFTPFIDPRYKERSLAEAKLTDIIPLCWTYDASQRIDIFQLADLLRSALQEVLL